MTHCNIKNSKATLEHTKSNVDVSTNVITSDKMLLNIPAFNMKNTITGHTIRLINTVYEAGTIKFIKFANVP